MTRPRRTELFIIMIIYNEDDSLFTTITQGVMKNITYLFMRDCDKTWGEVGWKNVVVHIQRPFSEGPYRELTSLLWPKACNRRAS